MVNNNDNAPRSDDNVTERIVQSSTYADGSLKMGHMIALSFLDVETQNKVTPEADMDQNRDNDGRP